MVIMKIPQQGDVVTPKETTSRYTCGINYKVTRTDKGVFYVIDDWNIEKQCYLEEQTIVQRATIFERICNFVNKILGI